MCLCQASHRAQHRPGAAWQWACSTPGWDTASLPLSLLSDGQGWAGVAASGVVFSPSPTGRAPGEPGRQRQRTEVRGVLFRRLQRLLSLIPTTGLASRLFELFLYLDTSSTISTVSTSLPAPRSALGAPREQRPGSHCKRNTAPSPPTRVPRSFQQHLKPPKTLKSCLGTAWY